MELNNEKFGNFIKSLRTDKNLTQKELGEKLNITDKAISKWERGLSFPDINMLKILSDFFEVDISELLNGERGVKQDIDIEKVVNEAIEKYKNLEEKRKVKINKIKRIIGVTSFVISVISLIIQCGYLFILKRNGFEYIIDSLEYIFNEIIIVGMMLSLFLLIKPDKKYKIISTIIAIILTILNLIFCATNGFINKNIVSFSENLSNILVVKVDRENGTIKLYKNPRFILFTKEREQLSYELSGKIKKQWIANDICTLTYIDKEDNLREYVATYGDRGNGISYYYVTHAIYGDWQVSSQNGITTQLLADSKGIRITRGSKIERFEYTDCKQYGTTALVLFDGETPRYVVGLDQNCEIDDKTSIIKKDGTITLLEVSMNETAPMSMYCMIYKDKDDLSDYRMVGISANDYQVKNGIMYISYDGKEVIEVPGDFSNVISDYDENEYQISEYKTVFHYSSNGKKYIVYSDDKGNTWNTVEFNDGDGIISLQFLSTNIGYMLVFDNVTMGTAWGKILKTTDGGISWNIINDGIEKTKELNTYRRNSEIRFVKEGIGFVTMPMTSGDSSQIYMTQDDGKTFEQIKISNDSHYDYYNLPTLENNILYLEISQGNDGDYNGGDSLNYYSKDFGKIWSLVE